MPYLILLLISSIAGIVFCVGKTEDAKLKQQTWKA